MLFIAVLLTFAACLFGVVAIEVSMRQREEQGGGPPGAVRRQASLPAAFKGRPRQPAAGTPPSGTGTSRAA